MKANEVKLLNKTDTLALLVTSEFIHDKHPESYKAWLSLMISIYKDDKKITPPAGTDGVITRKHE